MFGLRPKYLLVLSVFALLAFGKLSSQDDKSLATPRLGLVSTEQKTSLGERERHSPLLEQMKSPFEKFLMLELPGIEDEDENEFHQAGKSLLAKHVLDLNIIQNPFTSGDLLNVLQQSFCTQHKAHLPLASAPLNVSICVFRI